MPSRAMSVRLPDELAGQLAAVARAEDRPISEVTREAIANHIATRRDDPVFQRRLKKRLEEDREVLERLAE
jgi:predicted transcriptional regulator